MRKHKSVVLKRLGIIAVIWTVCLFTGCRSAQTRQQQLKPVFFPPPPERPRLQFLKSFCGPEDLGAAPISSFEKFVLGEPKKVEGITTPYGIAIFEGKLYVCDVGKRTVEVLDLKNRTFGYLTKDQRLMNPVNIFIDDDGTKYIADPTAGAVFAFDRNDNLRTILGKGLNINPIDVVVRGSLCYLTDFTSNRIVILDKATGREIARVGRKSDRQRQVESLSELPGGEFSLISDLTLDMEGNIYVTDKAAARITQFDRAGKFMRTIGRLGDNIDEFIRPKGIAIDNQNRIWIVDAGTEVTKIYNQQAQLLLFFGLPGNEPGMMNLPAKIILDYDNVELFKQYAVEGADIEFLVLVSNQYGLNKVSVYGFGSFPSGDTATDQPRKTAGTTEPKFEPERQITELPVPAQPEPEKTDVQSRQRDREILELYRKSMTLYRAGQLSEARQGFQEVLKSGRFPAYMEKTIKGYITDINSSLATDEEQKEIAELYYSSMAFYRSGQLEKARAGLTRVLNSGLIPPAMAESIKKNIADINNTLAGRQSRRP